MILPMDTMCRQLLPDDYVRYNRGEYSRLWRWVLWHIHSLTYEQARVLHGMEAQAWCLVQCERGPKGGWTGATFVRPKPGNTMPVKRVKHTLYAGYLFDGHTPSPHNVPTDDEIAAIPDFEVLVAHLALHAA